MKPERIQKVLSESGVASRRRAEELIERRQVTVNGRPAVLGQKIDPSRDIVAIGGERVALLTGQKRLYIMLHKPRGYVTTMQDEMGRRCVADLLEDTPAPVYPIGRLDRNSEGLLLCTNDGDFANFIMHPRNQVAKTYRVTVRPDPTEGQLVALATGVPLETGMAQAQVMVLSKEPERTVLQMVLREGKNREIRRMCEAVGLTVARLKRTAVGPVKLGMLQPGSWRELTPAELAALRGSATKSAARAVAPKVAESSSRAQRAPRGAAKAADSHSQTQRASHRAGKPRAAGSLHAAGSSRGAGRNRSGAEGAWPAGKPWAAGGTQGAKPRRRP